MTGPEVDILVMAHYRMQGDLTHQMEQRRAIRCDDCGAIVLVEDAAVHDQWHTGMDRGEQ